MLRAVASLVLASTLACTAGEDDGDGSTSTAATAAPTAPTSATDAPTTAGPTVDTLESTGDAPASCPAPLAACGPGASLCDAACVDLEHDPANCGACGHACPPDVACTQGACVPDCAAGPNLAGKSVGCWTVTAMPLSFSNLLPSSWSAV